MELIRPAGLNELRCVARDDLKLYGSIISIAEYAGPRELHEADFVKALKQCVTEHPALATVVLDADTESPTLHRVGLIDFTKHCDVRNDNRRQFLEEYHNDPFTKCATRPQWRVVIQPVTAKAQTSPCRFQMAFVCSHNLMDGMSGPYFHSTFRQALNSSKNDNVDEIPIWQPLKGADLSPPLEKAGSLTISWSFLLGPLLNEYLPSSVASMLGLKSTSTDNIWKGASTRPHQFPLASLVPTKVHHTSISAEVLRGVLTFSKEHKSRLTGLLTHLTARALARGLKSRDQDYMQFTAASTINMRKALKCGEGQMANYPSSTEELVTLEPRHLVPMTVLTPEDLEAVAATTKHLEERSTTLSDQSVGLLRYLNDFRGWNKKNAIAPAKISFEISNVGTLDQTAGDWEIRDLVFSQSADASGPPMSVNVASTKGGKLNLAFVWSPGALGLRDEAVFIEEVAADVVRELNYISSEHQRR